MATKLPSVDVVVVGVGWAGGIISAELTKKGYKVVGLERGKERKTEDFLNGHDELKYAHRKELMQDLSKDTLTFRNKDLEEALPMRKMSAFSLGTGVGGAGVHWNGFTHLFLDYDFQIRTKTIERYGESKIPEDMTLQDWGITEELIEPYFKTFVEMAGTSGEQNPLRPRSWDYPNPPMKVTPKMKRFIDTTEEMGLNPFISPSGNLSQNYTNPDGVSRAACQYCAFCDHFGCEYGAKSDPLVTVLPVAQSTGNFELRAHSNVLEVLHENGKATGVRYINVLTGEEYIQEARVVILSAYTFTNTKLLLNSKIGTPYDPVTQTGAVGKNYADHFLSMAFGFFDDEQFNDYAGAGALGVSLDDYNGDFFDHTELDFIHGGLISISQVGNRPIGSNLAPLGTPGWGAEFKKQSLYYYNRQMMVFSQTPMMPNRYNYLSLDPTYKDEYGMPLLRMTVNYSKQENNAHKFMTNKCAEIMENLGATHIMAFDQQGDYNIGSFVPEHSIGGTIMGEDPATSVVNNYSQVWDVNNVFVLGASTFASQSGVNPTGTLGALAYRAAEGIDSFLKEPKLLV
ncbi:GMC family oxidoreductase [Ureibacillus sinduriensis]|uniref:GMC family oxidoreductase n=1 Tax=Ureibacillus sinduriensis BLB-1 = JCM 15800 TaxID=1384057 RepID=A0A0A3I9I8_9BACL|nr:GMC family oxidoreductase [Ureibacillus sinduriensis]KGR79453.1 GMC family oxidoreductase [Ureibacillus sinduriensis BLB-1 = JCM 15800]